jgi:aldehyde:ferredoxin oxidoreductase
VERLLRVDMGKLEVRFDSIPEEYRLLGGRGLIAKIMLTESEPAGEPLRPESLFIVAPGTLSGTGLSSSGRISVGGKSPLTRGIKESNAGGTIAHRLVRLGIRVIIVSGQPQNGQKYVLRLTTDGAELVPAAGLSLLGCYETATRLLERYGMRVAVACIGPAGEREQATAAVAHTDPEGRASRMSGRGGTGAIMGAKGLKAIVVDDKGTSGVPMVDRETFRTAVVELTRLLKAHPLVQNFYRTLGTPLMVSMVNEFGALPTRNFSEGRFEEMEAISGERMLELIAERGGEGTGTHSCMLGCLIQCSNIYPDKSGRTLVAPLEYETMAMFGSNCGIGDLDAVAHFNWICNDIGIDTIDAGATMAVAMEAGVIEFGDVNGVERLLAEIREGTVLGRLLAAGTAVTGRVLGVSRVPTVKGQAMAAYDPRAIKGNGVAYCTSPMGADHTAGNVIRANIDKLSWQGQADISRKQQVTNAAYDTLGFCVFAALGYGQRPDLVARAVEARHGAVLPDNYVELLGKEVLTMEREFNRRAGFTELDDRIPAFMATEPLPPHNSVFDVPAEELDRTLRF